MTNRTNTKTTRLHMFAASALAAMLTTAMLASTSSCGKQANKTKSSKQAGPNKQQKSKNRMQPNKPGASTTAQQGKTPTARHPNQGSATESSPANPKQGSFPAASNKELSALTAGLNQFALDLYGKMSKKPGNLFFSPWSISVALAMTHLGARGKTAAEMESTLHLPKTHVDRTFGTMLKALTTGLPKAVVLNMANRIFWQVRYRLVARFVKDVARYYGSTAQSVDYKKAAAAVATINKWVSKQTNGRIPNLLSTNSVTDDTRLVLVNAIYFKGIWKTKFKKRATNKQNFFTSPKTPVKVDMMHGTIRARYGHVKGYKILSLPYSGKRVAMVILLPDRKDGLAAMEKTLTGRRLATTLQLTRSHKVHVSLPKFHLSYKLDLKSVLMALGMKLPFDRSHADFSGVTKAREGLAISAVIHQANCDVDEQGTVAAAATAVTHIRGRGAAPRVLVFNANHPFILMIRDQQTGAILFMGRLAKP
ncbi:MAG: serpin family protein [Deltaproteobacteria bacterium]|nr:serpin family protein [Deltaproteobacteria bacterium]